MTPYSRTEYDTAYEVLESDDNVERARKFCVKCWQGFGCANLYHNGFKSGQTERSPNPAKAWSEISETMNAAHERLRGVQIEHLEAIEIINRYDTEDVFIYCDPPYLTDTRKGYLYKHEMTREQHIVLLENLKKHKGKVMISCYENELYDSMLLGWDKVFKTTQAEHGLKRVECLYMNYQKQLKLF